MSSNGNRMSVPQNAIAIIGMSGRFPGAPTIPEFWNMLCRGDEGTTVFSDEELLASGVPADLLRNPNYVRSRPVLDAIDCFDAGLFGISPRDAELMDPQHRIFLECAWAALEDAGHDPWKHPGRIGVFASAGKNTYLLLNLLPARDWMHSDEVFSLLLGNEKDYLSSRVSYKLNLRGPSITVQSACSSSLVAVHLACQSILLGECDMAIAGGVSADPPRESGHLYRPGGILSDDGHCRAFDAGANGVVFGQGAGIVVLRAARDAMEDRDHIYALIRGTAVNNDGARRAGFTAPSIDGQADAIREAMTVAGVEPGSISYVEAHGTATAIGDPIEVAALTKAFGRAGGRTQFCALGSVKTNIGHMGPAAGIAGVIKTALAFEHGKLPPTVNYRNANSQIDFANSPFYVNCELRDWTVPAPRRASVSSFGQGGTNAHITLEEAPKVAAGAVPDGGCVLCLSAHTRDALDRLAGTLARHLETHSECMPADIAYTLRVGRRPLRIRAIVPCESVHMAVAGLRSGISDRAREIPAHGAPVVHFFFPEASYDEQIATRLGKRSPEFARAFKEWIALAPDETSLMWLSCGAQYAAAKMWQSWGIRPSSFDGEGAGAIVARLVSGAMPLEEAAGALRQRGLTADRGRAAGIRLIIAPCEARNGSDENDIDCGSDAELALSRLWQAGVEPDWLTYYLADQRLRVSLPTYPFERQRFWVAPKPIVTSVSAVAASEDLDPYEVVAHAFCSVLGVASVQDLDNFFEMGGHSLLEAQVRSQVEKATGVELPQGVLFDHPTVSELAAYIEERRNGARPRAAFDVDDVLDDVMLDADIDPSGLPDALAQPPRPFLTGATGLLGAHILEELLRIPTAEVTCLLRADSAEDGRRRLREAAGLYGLDFGRDLGRVVIVPGDLSARRFGLTTTEFERLANHVNEIYHCGANVNFVQPYRALRAANVDAVKEVLRLAATATRKRVHYTSSIAVFESDTFEPIKFVNEDEDLGASRGYHNGYDLSKWAAERVVAAARSRNAPVSVYRLSNIGGSARTGAMLPRHIVSAFIKGCIEMGCAPGEDDIINLLPADAAARIVVKLARSSRCETFHVVNPASTRIRDVIGWLGEYGYTLTPQTYVEWRESLRRAAPDNAFRPFLPLLDEAALFTNRSYDISHVRRCLPSIVQDCPPFDAKLFGLYVNRLKASGYLPAPAAAAFAK